MSEEEVTTGEGGGTATSKGSESDQPPSAKKKSKGRKKKARNKKSKAEPATNGASVAEVDADAEVVLAADATVIDAPDLSDSHEVAPETDTVDPSVVDEEAASAADDSSAAASAEVPEASADSDEPEGLEGVRLRQVLESLLFASSDPLSLRRLNRMLKEAPKAEIEAQLLALEGDLATDEKRGYSLIQDAGGYRLLTRPELAPFVARLRGERKRIRLSKAAFETLAIIAYRQPIRRADLDSIRGVQSGTIVKNLMEWNLVGVAGRDEAIGRALLYATTDEFLDQFGLNSLGELPDPSAFLELGSSSGVVVAEEVSAVEPGPVEDHEPADEHELAAEHGSAEDHGSAEEPAASEPLDSSSDDATAESSLDGAPDTDGASLDVSGDESDPDSTETSADGDDVDGRTEE